MTNGTNSEATAQRGRAGAQGFSGPLSPPHALAIRPLGYNSAVLNPRKNFFIFFTQSNRG